jgi:hypothetical protein
MASPAEFSGKMVKFRAQLEVAFEYAALRDPKDASCAGPWFDTAERHDGTQNFVTAEDAALQQEHPAFLKQDDNWKKFEDAMAARVYPRVKEPRTLGNMGGYPRYEVVATMTGRLDVAGDATHGFGQLGQWRVRLMLVSVEDVATVERPYDWTKFSREPLRFPQGSIRGSLTDAAGKPVKMARVEAITPDGKLTGDEPSVYTKEDGTFALRVEPGRYYVVAERTHAATVARPYAATYAPSSEDKAGARLLTVDDQAELTGLNIQIRRSLELHSFDVRVVGPDDKPVGNASVRLTEAVRDGFAGLEALPRTDADGRVTLKLYAGIDYLLWAEDYDLPNTQCAPVRHVTASALPAGPILEKLALPSQICSKQWEDARKATRATLFP